MSILIIAIALFAFIMGYAVIHDRADVMLTVMTYFIFGVTAVIALFALLGFIYTEFIVLILETWNHV